jgi:hypothetical protein
MLAILLGSTYADLLGGLLAGSLVSSVASLSNGTYVNWG